MGLVLLASVLVPLAVPAEEVRAAPGRALGDSPWPTFHGDNARTGNTTEPGPSTCRMLWSNGTGQNCYSSPAVAGEKVFIGSSDAGVYCFNATNGTRLWRTGTGSSVHSSPAVDIASERLYVGSMDHYLYCLNTSSGAQVWRNQTGGDLTSSPLLHGGRVYIGCGDWYYGQADGYLYCFDAATGERLWRTAGAGGAASPALADGRLFTMSNDDLHCLDPETGAFLWNSSVGTTYYGSPAAAEGRVFCSAGNGHLYCFNASDGTELWEVNSGFSESQSTPAVSNGSVYACFDNMNSGCLKKYHASNGTLAWTYNTQGTPWGGPTVTGGRVYFCNDLNILCLNTTDASHVWSYNGTSGDPYGITGSPALWADRLYVGGAESKLYCIGPKEPNRPPSAVVLSAPHTVRETSACLRWNQSGEPDFARYEVHRSTVRAFTPDLSTRAASISSRMANETNITGLNYSTRYFFKIRVWDNGDPEMYNDSNEVEAVTATPNGAPAAVVLQAPADITPFSMGLSWSKSPDADFARYELHRSLTGPFTPSALTLVKCINSSGETTALADGLRPWTVYHFMVRVYDNGSPPLRNDSNEVSARSGNTPPEAVALNTPQMGSTSAILTWTASAEDDFAAYEVHFSDNASFVLGAATFAACITARYSTEHTVEGLQLARTYQFAVRTVDQGGLFNDSAVVSGTTENTVPKAVISSPLDGDAYDTRTEVIFDGANSSDLDRDPLTYYWTSSIDGYLSSAPSFSRLMSLGGHRITLCVNDGSGHNVSARIGLDIVKAPNRPPSLSVLWPSSEEVLSGTAIVCGTASDPDGDGTLAAVEIKIGSGDWREASGTANWSFSWNTTKEADGKLRLLLRAYDGELYSAQVAINIRVSNAVVNQRPMVAISSPLAGSSLSKVQTVAGTATDPDGRVVRVELRLNAGGWFTVSGAENWSYALDTRQLRDGRHTMEVRAFDGVNYSEPASLEFWAKNAAPAAASGGIGTALLAGGVLAAVAAAVAAFLLLRRRRKGTAPAAVPPSAS